MTSTKEQKPTSTSYQNGGIIISDQRESPDDGKEISNEYVLNVAFWTFLGFLLLEAVFAIIANSQAMLEDAEAMSVDALTYLFNLCAERIKHRPYSEKEMALSLDVREYRRELLRLYLELIPPFLSVTTLIVVTGYAMKDAFETISQPDDIPEEDVDVNIMFWFSAANLVLDIVNVTCFARAHQAFGLTTVRREIAPTSFSIRDAGSQAERTSLVKSTGSYTDHEEDIEDAESEAGMGEQLLVNLNMCSAWTVSLLSVVLWAISLARTLTYVLLQHICADTLRSSAVLVAAGISQVWPDVVSGELADSMATIVVSIIILVSLIPLLHGLYETAKKILILSKDPRRPQQ